MQQAQTYRERSHEYLARAFSELADQDLTQASEKGWGAAAQIVKAVADYRGEDHGHHRSLFRMADRLREESGDPELSRLFDAANSLHTNFYEDALTYEGVEERLQRVRTFVEKVERFLPVVSG